MDQNANENLRKIRVRKICERRAYTISGEFGYMYRSILENADETGSRIDPYWFLERLVEFDPTFQKTLDIVANQLEQRFVT